MNGVYKPSYSKGGLFVVLFVSISAYQLCTVDPYSKHCGETIWTILYSNLTNLVQSGARACRVITWQLISLENSLAEAMLTPEGVNHYPINLPWIYH